MPAESDNESSEIGSNSLNGNSSDSNESLNSSEDELVQIERQRLRQIIPYYDSDTSDENEDTLGNIPRSWYDEYDHMGYDLNGQKIPKSSKKDEIDEFLENKNYVLDKSGNEVRLSRDELLLLEKIQKHEFPPGFNDNEEQVEYFSSIKEIMPLSGAHEPKRRFIPSKTEGRMIMKIAQKLRLGKMKTLTNDKEQVVHYDIWKDQQQIDKSSRIQAPKISLPEHNESYNPPVEYLLNKDEEEEWLELDDEDKPHKFLPKKYSSLRQVPAYPKFLQERFERLLDLYLCPRTIKQKLDIDPESLIPKLPSPKELKPFPTKLSIVYKGHQGRIRTICVDNSGKYLASGCDDLTVKIWEVSTGRVLKTLKFEETIMSLSWNPNNNISLLAVTSGTQVILVNPGCSTDEIEENTVEFVTNTLLEVAKNDCQIKWTGSKDEDQYLKLEFNRVL